MRATGYIPPRIKNRPDWGFVCGRISALESKLLNRDFFRSIIEMHHTDDIFQHFQGSMIENYLDPGVLWADFSATADQFFYDMVMSIRADSPSPVPADIFLLKNDYLNIKNAFAGIATNGFPTGIMPRTTFEAIEDGDYSQLPVFFRGRVADSSQKTENSRFLSDILGNAYMQTIVEKQVTEPAQKPEDIHPSLSDVFVDGAYLRHLFALSQKIDSAMIQDCIDIRILGHVITSLWRVVRQGRDPLQIVRFLLVKEEDDRLFTDMAEARDPETWPALIGGEIGDLLARTMQASYDEQVSTFDLKVINFVLHMITQARQQTSGPERVFAFLMEVEAEIQNLKLVVTGKLNRIHPDALDQRLRYIYG